MYRGIAVESTAKFRVRSHGEPCRDLHAPERTGPARIAGLGGQLRRHAARNDFELKAGAPGTTTSSTARIKAARRTDRERTPQSLTPSAVTTAAGAQSGRRVHRRWGGWQSVCSMPRARSGCPARINLKAWVACSTSCRPTSGRSRQ